MQANWQSDDTEAWVSDLRQELVESGFEPARVDRVITGSLERFRSSRVHDFIPLLVERAAYRALRSEP